MNKAYIKSRNIPCFLVSICSSAKKNRTIIVAPNNPMIISRLLKTISTGPTAKVYISNGTPNPMKMSKMLEPNTLDVASSICPFLALTNEITASGIEVAAAVIVKAIIMGEMFNISANSMEDSVMK